MSFDSFEQQRREESRRKDQDRQERAHASRRAAIAVKAELADLAAAFVKNSKYPPNTNLVQRHTTYSRETVRKGWNPFAKPQGGIVQHSQINLRAEGWNLGATSAGSLDSLNSYHWYLDTSGGLWFEIKPSLHVRDVETTYGEKTTGRTPQAQERLDSLKNTRFTGDALPTKTYKSAIGYRYTVIPSQHVRLSLDELHEKFADSSEGSSIKLSVDHLFTVPEGYFVSTTGLPNDFEWGPKARDSDWLHHSVGERETPLIRYVYECALKMGIIA